MRALVLAGVTASLAVGVGLSDVPPLVTTRLCPECAGPKVAAVPKAATPRLCPLPAGTGMRHEQIRPPGAETLRWTPRGLFASLVRGRARDAGFAVHRGDVLMPNSEDAGRAFCGLLTGGGYGVSWGAMPPVPNASAAFTRGCRSTRRFDVVRVFTDFFSMPLAALKKPAPPPSRPTPPRRGQATRPVPPRRGVYESVNPKTGDTSARDVTLYEPGSWRALTPRLIAALRRNNANSYQGLSDREVEARLRTEDTYLLTLESRTAPDQLGTLVVTLDEGLTPGLRAPGTMYIGQLTSPAATTGGGGELLELALGLGRTRGMTTAVAYTNNVEGNARFYLLSGASMKLASSPSDRERLDLRWSLRPDRPHAGAGAVCEVHLGGLPPARQGQIVIDQLRQGHTVFGYDAVSKTFKVQTDEPPSPRL